MQPKGASWPKISIVTPSYNQGQFIEETIRSILLQGYPNLEFMVIDGGSTDESVDIIQKYAPWITHWVSEADEGQSDAINKGFRRATGDVYNWINSDDFLRPGALPVIGRLFSLPESIDWVTGGRIVRSVEYRTEEVQMHWRHKWPKYVLGFPAFPQDATFFTADVWEAVGGLDSSLHYMMDVLFFHQMLQYSRTGAFSSAVFSCMNLHSGQKTKGPQTPRKAEESDRVQRRMLQGTSRAMFRRLMSTRFHSQVWNVWRTIAQLWAPSLFREAQFDYEEGGWELVPFEGAR